MFKYSATTNRKRIITYANLIKKHKLMLNRGGIKHALVNRDDIIVIGLIFNSKRPIGCCVVTKRTIMLGCNLSVFINCRYRGLGLGRKLLDYTRQRIDPEYELVVYTGTHSSNRLFRDISCRELKEKNERNR